MTRSLSATVLLSAALAIPAAGQNLLTNTSFDTGINGWSPANTAWISDAGNPSGSGPGCVEVTAPAINGGGYFTGQMVAVEGGVTYEISGWAYVPDRADNIAAGSEFLVQWFSGSELVDARNFPTNTTRGQWTRITGQATAPAGVTSAEVWFGVRGPVSGSGTPKARWDDVSFGPPQTGQLVADYFVLAAGYGQGKKGTFWTTDVSVFNPTAASLGIQATFFQGIGDNSGATPVSLGSIAAGATMSIPNIVHAAGGSGTGAVRLRFTAPQGATSATAAVTARTWTPWLDASIGQGATAISSASATASAVGGLVENAAFRTNVGVFNAMGSTRQARVRIFDSAGTVLYDQTWTLGPYGQSQVSLPSLGISSLEGGALRVDGAGVLAYVTPADNVSGDAAFLEARPVE
ncbi:MAG: carbohydrate binding domain-containing protein [Acidobacteriia bacterium]|nr:carbohydrate binding domain-containing protein [Terriglobia bacterium]